MSSTTLGPLKKTLQKAYALAYNMEQEVGGLVRVVDYASGEATEIEAQADSLALAVHQLAQTIRQGKMKAAEFAEMPSGADKIADAQLVAEGLDSLLAGMPAYQLARELELVKIDNYLLAFTELSTYEGGLERLAEIRDAAERVMLERRGKLAP